MPAMIFVHADGSEERLECREGMTVLDGALHYGIAGVRGQCGGVAICGTCHCRVLGGWVARVGPASGVEAELLEVMDDTVEGSRLACQIRVTKELDGVRIQWLAPGPVEGAA